VSRRLHVEATARDLVRTVLDASATLGEGRLVCVDGPAGSGKTTLAGALDRGFRDALRAAAADREQVRLLHMDDLFEGWSGLEAGMATMADDVVAPLRSGRPGRYRRYDWHRSELAEEVVVEPCQVLVVEGVGSGNAAYDAAVTLLVWLDAPSDVRLERGVARDGEPMRDHWLRWRVQEDAMFARQRTRERADVVVDGTG
jgi:uridine kinase